MEKRNQKENRTYYAAQPPAAYSVNPNQQPVSTPPPNAIGNSHCQGEDTTEFESPPTDRITLLHCVEILRSGIKQGGDAIKGILKRWVEDLRWETVLELEAIAPDELLCKRLAISTMPNPGAGGYWLLSGQHFQGTAKENHHAVYMLAT